VDLGEENAIIAAKFLALKTLKATGCDEI